MCCCYAALALWLVYSTNRDAELPGSLIAPPERPSQARPAIDQRFPWDQLLRSRDQVAFHHDADDVPVLLPYTSSIVTRSPTIAAARCRLPSVMSFFGSRIRSTWVRLVLSSAAILFLEIFFFFMASASCHATTSLTACACASSKMPSCLRKSSRLEPICFLLIAPTPSGAFARLAGGLAPPLINQIFTIRGPVLAFFLLG